MAEGDYRIMSVKTLGKFHQTRAKGCHHVLVDHQASNVMPSLVRVRPESSVERAVSALQPESYQKTHRCTNAGLTMAKSKRTGVANNAG
jgi:hypothetical protein